MMLSHSVLISSLLGTVTLILVVSFGPSLLKLMGTTKDFAGPAANYLYIRAVSGLYEDIFNHPASGNVYFF